MRQKEKINESYSSSIPAIVHGTALASATISISLAAICLALLSLSRTQGQLGSFYLPTNITFALPLIGVALVFNAALTIDWIIDRFEKEDWAKVLRSDKDPNRSDQVLARLQLFNGGYFILCLCMAGLCFTILSEAASKLESIDLKISKIAYFLSFLFSGYIIFQMMTLKAGNRRYAPIALILTVGIIIGAILVG